MATGRLINLKADIKAGRLDRKVTLQRVQIAADEAGDPGETWVTIVSNVWAQINPITGSEQIGGEQLRSSQQYKITIRWSQAVADLSPLDRVVYPASSATDSPSLAKNIFDIWAVNELGRHQGLEIVAIRRSDVSP